LEHWQALLWAAAILVGTVSVALVGHYVVFVLAKRVSRRTGSIIQDSLVRHGERAHKMDLSPSSTRSGLADASVPL
jgi:hypothetical protein